MEHKHNQLRYIPHIVQLSFCRVSKSQSHFGCCISFCFCFDVVVNIAVVAFLLLLFLLLLLIFEAGPKRRLAYQLVICKQATPQQQQQQIINNYQPDGCFGRTSACGKPKEESSNRDETSQETKLARTFNGLFQCQGAICDTLPHRRTYDIHIVCQIVLADSLNLSKFDLRNQSRGYLAQLKTIIVASPVSHNMTNELAATRIN